MIKLLLFSAYAFAEEAVHHGGEVAAHGDLHAIPWWSLFVQAFNFIFIFVFLGWIMRKAVKAHFAHRANEYKMLVDRADSAKREAEQGHHLIKERLSKLESGAEASLATASREAEELKGRMIQEAKVLSDRLQTEATRTTASELEKAKAELRRELLQAALKSSSEILQKSLGTSEQKQLQNEFVEKMVGG